MDIKHNVKKGEAGLSGTDEPTPTPVVPPVTVRYPQPLFATPIVLERKKTGGKGKRRRYTRGTGGLQRLTLGLAKGAYRVADSFADGLDTFSKQSNKSSKRRRDGLIRDSLRNASSGIADGLAELGRAPGDVARKIRTRDVWRTFRFFTLS
jgi:hypothetical protein